MSRLVSALSFFAALAAAVPMNILSAPIQPVDPTHNGMAVPISNPGAKDIIENRYIVVFNNTFDDDAINTAQAFYTAAIKKRNIGKRSVGGSRILSTEVNTFQLNTWRAMALDADDAMANDIYNSAEVAYIEADTKVSLSAALAQTNAPPGLNRLSHAQAGQANYIFDTTAGAGITAYVVDTGVKVTHTEFEGRATLGANFIDQVVCRPDDAKEGYREMVPNFRCRTTTRTATAATSQEPLLELLLVSPRPPTLLESRSSAPTDPAATPVSSRACSSSSRTSSRRTLPARLL